MRALLVALMLAAMSGSAATAQEAQLPAELKLPLLVKVLSFDRRLQSVEGDIVVAVVYQHGVPASLQERDVWLDAADQGLRLNGYAVRVVPVEHRSDEQLIASLRAASATVVFLTTLRTVDTSAVAERVRSAGFRTATDSAALVGRSTSLGLLLRSGRPHIVINMALAKREGADYSAQLLRLAEVVR